MELRTKQLRSVKESKAFLAEVCVSVVQYSGKGVEGYFLLVLTLGALEAAAFLGQLS